MLLQFFTWKRGCAAATSAMAAAWELCAALHKQAHPGAHLGGPPLSAWLFRLQDGRAAEADLKGLADAMGGKHTEHDLIRHNLVVFKGGEGAQQVQHLMIILKLCILQPASWLQALAPCAAVLLHCKLACQGDGDCRQPLQCTAPCSPAFAQPQGYSIGMLELGLFGLQLGAALLYKQLLHLCLTDSAVSHCHHCRWLGVWCHRSCQHLVTFPVRPG